MQKDKQCKNQGLRFFTVIAVLMSQGLYAYSDYRCTDKSLCETPEYAEVSSIDEAFSEGKVTGRVRLAYINQDYHTADSNTKDDYANAVGGQLKFETAKFKHVSLDVSVFMSQKVSMLSGDQSKGELNGDFFDAKGDSFAYVGKAYLDYTNKNFNIRIGRQMIDTPLNDRDDIRMLPNTFEALMVGYGGLEKVVLVGGYISRWAGFDSGNDISKFKKVPGRIDTTGEVGEGAVLLGIMHENIKDLKMQAWYYDFDKVSSVIYLDMIYETEYSSGINLQVGMQYGHYSQKSSSRIEGEVYGGSLSLGYKNLQLGVALNDVHTHPDKVVYLGYGGGPYFSSMQEMTIDSMNDAEAYAFFTEIDLSTVICEGVSFSYAYGQFNGDDGAGRAVKYQENDLVLVYEANDKSDLEMTYAYVKDKVGFGDSDTGYNRLLIRANYKF